MAKASVTRKSTGPKQKVAKVPAEKAGAKVPKKQAMPKRGSVPPMTKKRGY